MSVAPMSRAPARRKAYEFIQAEYAAGRGMPGASAIARHMGWKSAKSAVEVCSVLAGLNGVLGRRQIENVGGRGPRGTEYFLPSESAQHK